MKGNKKFVSVGVLLLVLLGIFGGTAEAASTPAFKTHAVKVNPTYQRYMKLSDARSDGKVLFPCQNNSNPTHPLVHCYGPDQIRQAYGVKTLLNGQIKGKGASITIIDAYGSPTIKQDLATFDKVWGLPDPVLNVAIPFGVTGTDSGWAIETTLDVEWAHVMAPDATINLIVAKTNDDVDIYNATKYTIDNNIGDVISQSFGENESCVDPALLKEQHKLFEAATKKGITILASSGDSGSTQADCAGTKQVEAVSSPAVDPWVTAVGGTQLTADAVTGKYIGETAWNESGSFSAATGGGYSVLYPRPGYQTGVSNSKLGRAIPDVALNASIDGGVLVFITDPSSGDVVVYVIGGTSVSSPEFAGIVADGVQKAGHRLGFLNTAIYQIGKSSSYSNAFNDIRSGDNILLLSGIPGYITNKGWDPVTGWGTPKAPGLLDALIGFLH